MISARPDAASSVHRNVILATQFGNDFHPNLLSGCVRSIAAFARHDREGRAEMNRTRCFFGGALAAVAVVGGAALAAADPKTPQGNGSARCSLKSHGNQIKHVVYLQFDNVHLRCDIPGVLQQGEFGDIFSDHTDIQPTMLRLVGLADDYTHDGRVLFEALTDTAAGGSLRAHDDILSQLAAAYKAINAPRGELGSRTLTGISTTALAEDASTYASLEAQIQSITAQRNDIAGKMIKMLEDAAFNDQPINESVAAGLINQAYDLIASIP
jgi:hypothetical protein